MEIDSRDDYLPRDKCKYITITILTRDGVQIEFSIPAYNSRQRRPGYLFMKTPHRVDFRYGEGSNVTSYPDT